MRKLLTILVITIITASIFTVPAIAAGGEGTNAFDVCWIRLGTDIEVKAKLVTTPSGIVQQFRYEPEQMHGVFMPVSEFPNEPDEGDWFLWTAQDYEPCDPDAIYEFTDFLIPDELYWVQLEPQY